MSQPIDEIKTILNAMGCDDAAKAYLVTEVNYIKSTLWKTSFCKLKIKKKSQLTELDKKALSSACLFVFHGMHPDDVRQYKQPLINAIRKYIHSEP